MTATGPVIKKPGDKSNLRSIWESQTTIQEQSTPATLARAGTEGPGAPEQWAESVRGWSGQLGTVGAPWWQFTILRPNTEWFLPC